VKYIDLPREERAIVLRVWRNAQMYPLPKEVVEELIQQELSKYRH